MMPKNCTEVYKKDENVQKMEFDGQPVIHDFRRLVDQDGKCTFICEHCGAIGHPER